MVGDLKNLNKALAKSFSAVKRDMNELRDENKKQAKIIKGLAKENKELLKNLENTRKSVILSEQYDFIERRIDELEEEMFNLEDRKLDKKKFDSSFAGIKHQFRTRENLGAKLNELKNFRAEIEHLNLANMNLSNLLLGVKKGNKGFITKNTFNKELKKLKQAASDFSDLKNSLAIIELRFDEIEDAFVDVVKDKELLKVKNKINKRIRELEQQINQRKRSIAKNKLINPKNMKNKSFLEKVKKSALDFFEEKPKKKLKTISKTKKVKKVKNST